MKAMIVYASWFGHNRAIAELLTQEFATQGVSVVCAPAFRVALADLQGRDLLVLGTYTHVGHASRQLRRLCDTLPWKQLDHMAVAVFGTQLAEGLETGAPGGVDDLVAQLAARGCELVAPPLRIVLSRQAAIRRTLGIGEAERRQVREFARELLEACVPAPLL
jgi:flavodoxin